MVDEMASEDKPMLMRCQHLLQRAQVENSILIAKAELREINTKCAKNIYLNQ
ncbi:hypothetical protein DPMN_151370 [Dreissena polymorpha]|uniref:Uncharacterized protein n=1 Tax=Dreissena polymorpha TaxID=45954 RepID=A0A9D4FF67_DREPO|nr:hypothetical protein DPMN_151370 [Dreissena polymorpha]